jgi:hypothetical protein
VRRQCGHGVSAPPPSLYSVDMLNDLRVIRGGVNVQFGARCGSTVFCICGRLGADGRVCVRPAEPQWSCLNRARCVNAAHHNVSKRSCTRIETAARRYGGCTSPRSAESSPLSRCLAVLNTRRLLVLASAHTC